MDRNTILAIALSLAIYSLWLAYETSQRPAVDDAMQQEARQAGEALTQPVTQADDALTAPRQESPGVVPGEPTGAPVAEVPAWQRSFEGERFVAELSNRGGTLTRWTLKDYWELTRAGERGPQIELVNVDAENPRALVTSFDELGFGDLGSADYRVESVSEERVTFALERGGVEIRKTYELDLDGFGFELLLEVRNGSDRPIAPDFEVAWPTVVRDGNDYTEQALIALHSEDVEKVPVGSVGSPGFFDRFFGNGEPEIWRGVAWAGVDVKYFAALLMPDPIEGTRADFEAREPGTSAAAVVRFSPVQIAPGQSQTRHFSAFLGPKEPALLESMGRELGRSVDLGYAWFEPLTRFFLWLLEACHGVIPNYGWSIVLITILARVAMLPILNRQMRSMEKMRALQPRMKEIQAEFADDRQKQSEAMMGMYKETGVNPLGGCFPMLLQFPVFIGLFFALQSSFALRQAPFVLWINDLSAPEVLFVIPGIDLPFRLMPLIMGGSMVLQQKLTPTTVDPSQQMMMMVLMPIMMTVLFYQFPSGLVLYWMISNFLGIAHQLVVGRRMKKPEPTS